MNYPLLPYSQLVFDMQKTNAEVYTSEQVVRLNKEDVDIPHLQHAIEQAIRNHPVFSMHVDEHGRQSYEHLSDIMHGQYHAVDIVAHDRFIDVHFKNNRILGDGQSGILLIEDMIRAYNNLPLEPDNYLNYLEHMEQTKQSMRYEQDRLWLEAEYGHLSCPVRPTTDAPIDITNTPTEGLLTEDYSALQPALNLLMQEQLIPLSAFFSLASALAIMEYNGCDEAALTWAYEGRENKEEQHIYGSLHRDIPFKISQKTTAVQKKDLIRQARHQARQGIAHSSYPLTLTYPHSDIWNYALNVLVQPSVKEKMSDFPFPFELLEDEKTPRVAYSLLDVEIYEEPLTVLYRYSATHYKEESIRRFAGLVRKYVEWLLES